MSAKLQLCPANDLQAWLLAEKYIQAALEHTDEWLWQDVVARYVESKVGLGLCLREEGPFAALIYEILETPRKRYFHIHLFGAEEGTSHDWLDACYPQLLAIARNLECDAVTGECRGPIGGWVKKLKADRVIQFRVPLWNGIEEVEL